MFALVLMLASFEGGCEGGVCRPHIINRTRETFVSRRVERRGWLHFFHRRHS